MLLFKNKHETNYIIIIIYRCTFTIGPTVHDNKNYLNINILHASGKKKNHCN